MRYTGVIAVGVLLAVAAGAKTRFADETDPGWDTEDATACLQGAIDSGADTVVVRDMGAPWIVRPVAMTRNHQTLILDAGVLLLAKADAFHGRGDALLTISGREDVTVSGYGAVLRMRKADYQDAARYEPAEWRHTVSISGGHNITVRGLRLESSGGDGVSVGGGNTARNVVLSDIVADDHHRQGISVTNVEGLRVLDSVFMHTWGTPPECGMDIEPDSPAHVIADVELVNTAFLDNRRFATTITFWHVDETGAPHDIRLRRCFLRAGPDPEADNEHGPLHVSFNPEHAPDGTITFDDCDFVATPQGDFARTTWLRNVRADQRHLTFRHSRWRGGDVAAIMFSDDNYIDSGNVLFEACAVASTVDVPFLRFLNFGGSIRDLRGGFTVTSPFAPAIDLRDLGHDIDLDITAVPTRGPEVTILAPAPGHAVAAGSPVRIEAMAHDPDVGVGDGDGIARVDFEVRRGDAVVAAGSDAAPPFEYDLATDELANGLYMVRVEAVSDELDSRTADVVPVSVHGAHPAPLADAPASPFFPHPRDGDTAVRTSTELTWTATPGATEYRVYLGASADLGLPQRLARTGLTHILPPALSANRTYYWRVDAVNALGTTPGPVWRFQTGDFQRLVAAYDFDEGEGSIVYDGSGNGHDGRIVGTVGWTEGVRGSALRFDGSASWVDLGERLADIATFGGPTGAVSIAAWARPAQVGSGWMITGVGGVYYLVPLSGRGEVRCQVKDTANNVNYWPHSSSLVEPGQWVHIVLVFEGGVGYRVYLNGQLDNEDANPNLSLYRFNENPAYLGNETWTDSAYYRGAIDDLRIYSHALTADAVRRLYEEAVGTAVAEAGGAVPRQLRLEPGHPNPFNPATVLRFHLPRPAPVELAVFDMTGARVATLVRDRLEAGSYRQVLAADGWASGVYLVRLRAGDQVRSRKVLLLR